MSWASGGNRWRGQDPHDLRWLLWRGQQAHTEQHHREDHSTHSFGLRPRSPLVAWSKQLSSTLLWCAMVLAPPSHPQRVLLKADVTKAHRRVKVLPNDWRFQVAELEGEWWVNKVGTYGMASAQLYWGAGSCLDSETPLRTLPLRGLGLRLCRWFLLAPQSPLLRLSGHGSYDHSPGLGNPLELEEDTPCWDQHMAGFCCSPQHPTSPNGGAQARHCDVTPG